MMNKKGQGALEYLLLIGGAVLVAVIVITLLLQITAESETSTEATVNVSGTNSCNARNAALCNDPVGQTYGECTTNTAYVGCVI